MQLEERYKNKLIRALHYHFPIAKIYLFGSRATGTARDLSDIDLALEGNAPLDHYEVNRAEMTIEHLNIPYRTDIVDFHTAPESLQQQILRDRVLLYDPQQDPCLCGCHR